MELGITGRRAIVCASSKGLGKTTRVAFIDSAQSVFWARALMLAQSRNGLVRGRLGRPSGGQWGVRMLTVRSSNLRRWVLRCFFTVALMFGTVVTHAVGLGSIEVKSHLNQTLVANIPLVGLKDSDLEELRVRLADDKQFKREGIERTGTHLSLVFTVMATAEGAGYVAVTSNGHMREPSLRFVVELNLRGGTNFRTYSILLDTD